MLQWRRAQARKNIPKDMTRVLAVLLLAVMAMASTAAASQQDEDPPGVPAPAPAPMLVTPTDPPVGAPEPSTPIPHPPDPDCLRRCEDEISQCVVDSCLHIPSGEDQAACIEQCISEMPICKYNCQLAAEAEHTLNYY